MALTDATLREFISDWKRDTNSRIYAPVRYFRGLTSKREVRRRLSTMKRRREKAKLSTSGARVKGLIAPYKTDAHKRTATSTWTKLFRKRYPGAGGSLRGISAATGVPLGIIRRVFNRGLMAYVTGHRPGTTPIQWAYARVYSFIVRLQTKKGPPHDKDLLEVARKSVKRHGKRQAKP